MRSDIVSRADLLYHFELNELDDLFVKLKLVCSQKNNQFSQDDLIMVQSRFNNYCFNRDNKLQSSDQIQIEFNQIKLTILTLIKSLDIEEGKISEGKKKNFPSNHFPQSAQFKLALVIVERIYFSLSDCSRAN